MSDTRVFDCLDTLMQTCRDSERAVDCCAGQAQSLRLQWLLTQRARCCRKSLLELQALRTEFADALPCGAQQPGWVVPEGMLASPSDAALLAECERGEAITQQHYRSALEEELPILLRAVAQRHFDAARSQRAQLRGLRLALSAPLSTPGARHLDVEAA